MAQEDRGGDDRLPGIAFGAEDRNEIAERSENQHGIGDVAEPGAQPVTPGAVEADEIAEAGAGIGIGPGVEFGFAHGEAAIDQRQGQNANAADQPADDDGAGRSALGHVLRQAEDAAADHRADD
jgi:hypothetical protein